jgi:membrane dipeptidase
MKISRRQFIERSGIALGGIASGLPLSAYGDDLDNAIRLLQNNPSFDLHCHPGRFYTRGSPGYGGDDIVVQTVSEMQNGSLWGGFFSVVADGPILVRNPDGIGVGRPFEPGEAWDLYQQQMSILRQFLDELPASHALEAADVRRLHEQSEIAAFVACEGAHFLEGRPERVELIYADGARSLQIAHYAPDVICDLQTQDPVHGGLSSVGKDVVQEMDRLGMLIDVAHASFSTVVDVAEISSNPLILSHSQLKWADKRHPRMLEPEHAEAVAATGGVIGMWPSGFGNDNFQDFVDNTMRLIDLVGVEHVGLGTDMDSNYKPVFDSYKQLPDWTAGLLKKGLSESDVSKVIGGNALRVISQVV